MKIAKSLKVTESIKFKPELTRKRLNEILSTLDLFENIENDIKNLNAELSRIDKSIDLLLHSIEQEDFSAYEGYKIAQRLQEMRRERRRIKSEITSLSKIYKEIVENVDSLKSSLRGAVIQIRKYESYVGHTENLENGVDTDSKA